MIVHVENVTPELSALIERYLAGEPIVFLKNGKPLLEFSPASKETPARRPIGFFGCEIDMSSFDDPLEEMEPYESDPAEEGRDSWGRGERDVAVRGAGDG